MPVTVVLLTHQAAGALSATRHTLDRAPVAALQRSVRYIQVREKFAGCDQADEAAHKRPSAQPKCAGLPRCRAVEGSTVAVPALKHAAPAAKPRLALPYRVGHGFDLHRLEEGPYKLILGGLEIPHDRGCVAHSDGAPRLASSGARHNCRRGPQAVLEL